MSATARKNAVMLSATKTAIDKFAPDYDGRNDRWLTPLDLVQKLGEFDLDPAGAPGHQTAREVWTPEEVGDGLSLPWEGRVWLNPPYGREMRAWVEQLARHGDGVAIIPARVDTALFHECVFGVADAVNFMRGRVRFQLPDGTRADPAAFPTCLVAYGKRNAQVLANVPGAVLEP